MFLLKNSIESIRKKVIIKNICGQMSLFLLMIVYHLKLSKKIVFIKLYVESKIYDQVPLNKWFMLGIKFYWLNIFKINKQMIFFFLPRLLTIIMSVLKIFFGGSFFVPKILTCILQWNIYKFQGGDQSTVSTCSWKPLQGVFRHWSW